MATEAREWQTVLWAEPSKAYAAAVLSEHHYLGPTARGQVYQDADGVLVFANPVSRHLPQQTWLELARWCITGGPNAGSRQWKRVVAWLRENAPSITTVVSYSDPSVGHTGALYRACNWLWAPTWMRLREPPSGMGSWDGIKRQAVKDRWVYPLLPDPERASRLVIDDEGLKRRYPWASFQEPVWKKSHPILSTGGGDYKRWQRK